MMNFMEVSNVPSPCFKGGTVVTVNLFKKRHSCPKCRRKVSYYGQVTDDNLVGTLSVFDWGVNEAKRYIIEDKKYLCPRYM